jgi:LysM repeat protein
MSTAQAQADFLAATGSMTHSGPGGIGLTARLLAAGYPLAGDLSLGGFRAENITGGEESMPAEAAVDQWTGDALHLNTMVSPSLTEIGAGVAISNGRVYYVIDAARPTTAGDPPVVATSVAGGSPLPENLSPEIIIPVSVSTPNADGNVFHDVKFGQTLWQIAIRYEVKIEDIKRLNNLFNNNIYPGSSLLIRQSVIVPTGTVTEGPTPAFTLTSLSMSSSVSQTLALTPATSIAGRSTASNNAAVTKVLIGIIALALVGGGIFTWLGSSRRK